MNMIWFFQSLGWQPHEEEVWMLILGYVHPRAGVRMVAFSILGSLPLCAAGVFVADVFHGVDLNPME
jgi:hypothetical protein